MNKKQSLFHIAKRDTLPWYKAVLIRGGAIVLALIVCAIVTTLLTGENPIKVYSTILYGAFGTSRKSWVTFHNLAILLGISLAVTPAFKMRFWNIGAEDDGKARVDHRHGADAEPRKDRVEDALVLQNAHPSIGAHQHVDPGRHGDEQN